MSDQTPFTPNEFDVCNVYVSYYMENTGKLHSEAEAEFARFIDRYTAKVKRDAAREALDGLAHHWDETVSEHAGRPLFSASGSHVRHYRDTHYPEDVTP